MLFKDMGLRAELVKAVAAKGYTQTTPIQEKAIPAILAGQDVFGSAQTGTGKTAAFTLPLLQLLSNQQQKTRNPRALILTPTRELAAQVSESVRTYGRNLPLRSAVIFGGVGINPQIDQLRRGADILTATPGRLLDHTGRGTVNLSEVEILVLDEADRMLDMGFIHDIRKVLQLLPKNRQNLLFAATYTEEIRQLADRLLHNPQLIQVAPRSQAIDLVTQVLHYVTRENKRALLSHLIREENWQQVLIFTRTKHGANRLARQLDSDGISSTAIHSNKSQAARTRALEEFKAGEVRILVATDIASRGLDIKQLPYVVNYELPHVAEDYIHRIGRTGRAGANGLAVSLVSADEKKLLNNIQRLLKCNITEEKISNITYPEAKASAADEVPEPFTRPSANRFSRFTRKALPGFRQRRNVRQQA